MTLEARPVRNELRVPLFHRVARARLIATRHPGHEALPPLAALLRAVEHRAALLGRKLAPRHVEVDLQALEHPGDGLGLPALAPLHRRSPRQDRAAANGKIGVRDQELRVHLGPGAQSVARRASADRRVERERQWHELTERQSAVEAGAIFGEDTFFVADLRDQLTAAFLQRQLDRVREPGALAPFHHDAVDHHENVVLGFFVECGDLFRSEIDHPAVHQKAREAALARRLEQLPVLALALPHQRRRQHQPRAFGQTSERLDDLRGGLPGGKLSALGAVLVPEPRVEHAQVVVDLGDRAHGRARVVRRGLLLDRDRRRKATNLVDLGLFHLPEELPRVRRQALDVTPLTFGVQGVERQRRLAAARHAGEHRERVLRNAEIDVLEIVLTRAGHDDLVETRRTLRCRKTRRHADRAS